MSSVAPLARMAPCALSLAMLACGDARETPLAERDASAPSDAAPADAVASIDASASEAGGCGPLTCASGCCKNGICAAGALPSQCGKGGLACVDCTVYAMGCVNQGCAVATCTNCDGCCLAGTCNTDGKSQDNACGKGGAVCVDCTGSGKTCDGNGACR